MIEPSAADPVQLVENEFGELFFRPRRYAGPHRFDGHLRLLRRVGGADGGGRPLSEDIQVPDPVRDCHGLRQGKDLLVPDVVLAVFDVLREGHVSQGAAEQLTHRAPVDVAAVRYLSDTNQQIFLILSYLLPPQELHFISIVARSESILSPRPLDHPAQYDIAVFPGNDLQRLFQKIRGHRIVVVHKGEILPFCRGDGGVPGPGDAAVFLPEQPDPAVQSGGLFDLQAQLVPAAVVHHDQLKVPEALGQDAVRHPAEPGGVRIVCGQDHRDRRHVSRPRIPRSTACPGGRRPPARRLRERSCNRRTGW